MQIQFKTIRIALVSVFFAASWVTAAGGEPAGDWKLPKSEADRWASRLQRLVGEAWKVTVNGNDIVIESVKPLQFDWLTLGEPARFEGGTAEDKSKRFVHAMPCHITLRFSSHMSQEEYDRLATINNESDRKERDLCVKTGVINKGSDAFYPMNPEQEKRVADFREAVRNLPFHDLPDFYTPDYTIRFIRSWSEGDYVYGKESGNAYTSVENAVRESFGIYHSGIRGERSSFGSWNPECKWP